jgi:branched-chain amino acid transport system substrate-binding protein
MCVVAVAVVAALAACGSSSGSSSAGGSAASGGSKATGTPIKLGFVNVEGSSTGISIPESTAGAKAAVSYLNAQGGLDGHPFVLDTCFEDNTPASWTNCANRLVADKPVAVIQGTDPAGGPVPIITRAGIPFFAGQPAAASELTVPGFYALSAGIPGLYLEAAAYAKANKLKKVSVLGLDAGAITEPFTQFGEPALKSAGIASSLVPIPPTAATFSSQAAAAVSGNPDLLIGVEAPQQCPGLISAIQATGYQKQVFLLDYCLAPASVTAIGSSQNYSFVTGNTFVNSDANPDADLFKAQMKKYQSSAAVDNASATSFLTVMNFARAMTTAKVDAGSLTPAKVNQALLDAKNVPMFLGGSTTFSCGAKSLPKLPQVCSNFVNVASVKNGAFVSGPSLPLA